jgi:hypothetical protein
MTALAQFGLLALLPAALGAGSPSERTMIVPLCSSESAAGSVEVPLGEPGTMPDPCGAKGCHGGSARKKRPKAMGMRVVGV